MRIHPREILRARSINKALLPLLPVCRDAASARNEFRWMQDHATNVSRSLGNTIPTTVLSSFVKRRARGEPLQYILGSEWFGYLEIKCRPGVLIPRQETAASVSHLVSLLNPRKASGESRPIRVLDLCTGTGCIPLLFHHEFYARNEQTKSLLELVGVDISGDALSLARENLILQMAEQSKTSEHNSPRMHSLHRTGFVQADVLNLEANEAINGPLPLLQALDRLSNESNSPSFDILISNPPYISPQNFQTTTSRSVRDYEPRLALVPPGSSQQSGDAAIGDLFYPRLFQIADQVEAGVFLAEVADMEQAKRVASKAIETSSWDEVEIWRDEPALQPEETQKVVIGSRDVKVRGSGHGRSVFAYRKGKIDLIEINSI